MKKILLLDILVLALGQSPNGGTIHHPQLLPTVVAQCHMATWIQLEELTKPEGLDGNKQEAASQIMGNP